MQSKYYSLSCYSTSVMKCFLFFLIVLFVWKSWCLLFILLLTSVHVFIFVHLSALLWTCSSSSSWKLEKNVSRNLGVLRTFVAFCFSLFYVFFFLLLMLFLFLRKSTSWVKYIECGLTQVLFIRWYKCFYIVQLEAHFIFQCVLQLVHSTVLL